MSTGYRVAEIALRVSDLPQAVAFYETTLGFQRHLELDGVVFLEIGSLESPLGEVGHPQLLALFDRNAPPDQAFTSLDHIAFEIPNADYDREKARYESKGMVISERIWPETLPWKGRSFFFRDPDGNVIELIAANPQA